MSKWWTNYEYPSLGGEFSLSHFNLAGASLLKAAFEGGPEVITFSSGGYLKEGGTREELTSGIAALGFRRVYLQVSSTPGVETAMYLSSDDSLLTMAFSTKRIDAALFTTKMELRDALEKKLLEILDLKQKRGVYALIENGPNMELRSIGALSEQLIRENYDPSVVESFDFVVKNLRTPDPAGRLTIINGKPGTGKTHLIKGLINEVQECQFVVMSPEMVQAVAGPKLLTLFSRQEVPTVFVLEDADSCLVKRQGDNMSAVQAMLNLADGIVGQILDFRIVATTNAKRLDMDEAIRRPGRLCRQIEMTPLTPTQANAVYARLTSNDSGPFKDHATLAQVYAASKGLDFEEQPDTSKKSFGFGGG